MRRPTREAGGFTIIELTVTLAILMIVMGSLLGIFASAQRSQAFVTNRSESLDDLRLTMDRIAKDLRQVTSVDATSSTSVLGIQTYILGVAKHVTYTASGTTLTRQEGSGASVAIQSRLTSTALFTYTPAVTGAQLIAVQLQMRPKNSPDTVLELRSEIRLRNVG